MEGAQAEQIRPGAFQIHILAHHVLNGVAGHYLVNKGRRKRHTSPSFPHFSLI